MPVEWFNVLCRLTLRLDPYTRLEPESVVFSLKAPIKNVDLAILNLF